MKVKCKCGNESVIERKYEGTSLCKQCFLKSVERKIKKTIRKDRLIDPKDKIAVALSGGKDSFLALYVLDQIIKPRKDIKLIAITVDPGIKGFSKPIQKAKKFCKELGIRHYVFSYSKIFKRNLEEQIKGMKRINPETTKEDICSACSVARRWVLNKEARKLGVTKICTGHNLDDEIQSVFMNYVRGDLMRAVRMSPEPIKHHKLFIPRIKPLREIPEEESALFAKLKSFDADRKKCPFRSGIRFEIGGFLDKFEEKHPGMKFSVLETFDKFRPFMVDAIKDSSKIITCKKCKEPSSRELCNTCELWK